MTAESHNPNAPIENLAIGTIIEVDGSHIVAELKPRITELSRIFGGDTYPIGQFGSIVKIHFGRRIIFAFVGRLRMKAEYESERGIVPQAAGDERVIEADLFGEGEWLSDTSVTPMGWRLKFDRGVATYPLPQQTVYLTPKRELRFIYGHGKGPSVHLGEHVGTGGTRCYAEMNELLGKHTAILGSTGAGKSATVAAVLHSLLKRGAEENLPSWKPRIVVLDPHNEYSGAFSCHQRLSTDDGSLALPYWLLNFSETIALVIGKTEFVATSQANIVKKALYQGPLCVTLLGFPFRLGCDSLLLQAGETHDSCGYTVGFIGEGPSRVGGEVNGCEGSAEDVGDCVGYGRVGPRGGGAELRDGPANLARLGVSLQCRGGLRACRTARHQGARLT